MTAPPAPGAGEVASRGATAGEAAAPGPAPREAVPGRPGPPEDGTAPIAPAIAWLLKDALINTRRAVDRVVREHGVSHAQWAILGLVALQPSPSGAELARQMLVTPQAVHQTLTTLERIGLVHRRPDPGHARIFRAELTEEGARVAELCFAASDRAQRELLEPFTAEEQAAFADLLQRYLRHARAVRERSSGAPPATDRPAAS